MIFNLTKRSKSCRTAAENNLFLCTVHGVHRTYGLLREAPSLFGIPLHRTDIHCRKSREHFKWESTYHNAQSDFHIDISCYGIPLWLASLSLDVCGLLIEVWGPPSYYAMPFLPDVRSIHVGMLCLQTVFVVVGPLGYLSIATYHEGCMYLSTLFKTLASHIVISTSRKSLNVLIGIHQELHTFGNKFSATFSRSWSFLHFMIGFFVTYTTYLILVGFVEPLYYVSACTVALALFVPCFLSELVAIACESVCQSAYSCDWINNDLSFKRDVALVILRSQKTLYLSEGVFGKLSLKKYLAIINDWYRMVQFFFNVG